MKLAILLLLAQATLLCLAEREGYESEGTGEKGGSVRRKRVVSNEQQREFVQAHNAARRRANPDLPKVVGRRLRDPVSSNGHGTVFRAGTRKWRPSLRPTRTSASRSTAEGRVWVRICSAVGARAIHPAKRSRPGSQRGSGTTSRPTPATGLLKQGGSNACGHYTQVPNPSSTIQQHLIPFKTDSPSIPCSLWLFRG